MSWTVELNMERYLLLLPKTKRNCAWNARMMCSSWGLSTLCRDHYSFSVLPFLSLPPPYLTLSLSLCLPHPLPPAHPSYHQISTLRSWNGCWLVITEPVAIKKRGHTHRLHQDDPPFPPSLLCTFQSAAISERLTAFFKENAGAFRDKNTYKWSFRVWLSFINYRLSVWSWRMDLCDWKFEKFFRKTFQGLQCSSVQVELHLRYWIMDIFCLINIHFMFYSLLHLEISTLHSYSQLCCD